LAINTDITLAANQTWQTGGTFADGLDSALSTPPLLTIGQSRTAHVNTVDTNGHVATIRTIATAHTMIINSDIIGTGALAFSKPVLNENNGGSVNGNNTVRILGTNTYSGNTDIKGSRQIMELGTSTQKNGQGQIISGPFGTGAITSTESQGSSQYPAYEPYLANRTLDNDITMKGLFVVTNNTTGTGNPGGPYTLTLNGPITVPDSLKPATSNGSGPANSSRIVGDSARGSGDVIVNGNVLLTGHATGDSQFPNPTFGAGRGGAPPTAQIGTIIFNGNLLQQPGAGNFEFHAEGWPESGTDSSFPVRVQLNGQNTFSSASIITKKCQDGCAVSGANIQLGSSSTLDGSNILSGPLGTGLVTIGGLPLDAAGNAGILTKAVTASMEAVGASPRTLANNTNMINDAGNTLTSTLKVQGSQNLTLSG
jgi:hypothetical protein